MRHILPYEITLKWEFWFNHTTVHHTFTKVEVCYDVTSVTRLKTKLNSVALVRKRITLTERPSLVGEVIANFLRIEGVT
jgi:hypothetical protein